ncbi:MAG: hemolysin III family protein, partial [Spirochaetia bacterium]|nr:hemolysin III family protein [Spirochaetia bacterium]
MKNTNSTNNTNSRLSGSSYSPLEEGINSISHGIGFLASIAALVLLIVKAAGSGDPLKIVSFSLFGISLLTLYAASTLYHTSKTPQVRSRLKIFDHAAIYVLIAGTYTPFTLVTLQGSVGWVIFAVSWLIAVTGIILKLFFIGRFKIISTIMYVLMGWIIIFAIRPLIDRLPADGLV